MGTWVHCFVRSSKELLGMCSSSDEVFPTYHVVWDFGASCKLFTYVGVRPVSGGVQCRVDTTAG